MIKCEVHAEPHAVPLVTWYKDEDGTLTKVNILNIYLIKMPPEISN